MVVSVVVESCFTGTASKEVSVTLTKKQEERMEGNPQDQELIREIKNAAEEILIEELYDRYTDVDIHNSIRTLVDHENFDFII